MQPDDFETARFNMVAQQIRPWEVIDERVLDALQTVPRERFVDPEYVGLAFADVAVPLGEGESMMKPVQEGRMLQALDVQEGDSVLEIGTGSGFVTACLSKLGGIVTSYEIVESIAAKGREHLEAGSYPNIELVIGDALHASLAPETFDLIAVTGSSPVYPKNLEALLRPNGRMFVVVGEEPAMQAMLVTRSETGETWKESLFETVLPALHNAPQADHFVF